LNGLFPRIAIIAKPAGPWTFKKEFCAFEIFLPKQFFRQRRQSPDTARLKNLSFCINFFGCCLDLNCCDICEQSHPLSQMSSEGHGERLHRPTAFPPVQAYWLPPHIRQY
jgi:hypothetical protein